MPHKIDNFFDAWYFLKDHPAFFYKGKWGELNQSGFEENLDIIVVKVDPSTGETTDDANPNGKVTFWLEAGGFDDVSESEKDFFPPESEYFQKGIPVHDTRLDCEGNTFEEAIMALAELVMRHYGDYVEHEICSHCLKTKPTTEDNIRPDKNSHWFCSPLCKDHHENHVGGATFIRREGQLTEFKTLKCEHFPDATSAEEIDGEIEYLN